MSNPIKEVYYYLKETYFSPDFSAIQNFDTYDVERFLPYLAVGICAGIFIAACIYYYCNDYLGRVVRRLYKAEAFSPEKAKSLNDINYNKYLIRKNLAKDTLLAKYVKATSEISKPQDCENALFYIPEDVKYIADKRFKAVKGGKLSLLITFIICFFACFALLFLIPQILQFADNLITITKG